MSAILRVATRFTMASAASARSMATGRVKWFNQSKGFGFITPDDAATPDIFVHHSGIQATGFRTLKDGEAVKFDVQRTDRGVQAVNVTDPAGSPFSRTEDTRPAGGAGGRRPSSSSGPRRERRERSPRVGEASS